MAKGRLVVVAGVVGGLPGDHCWLRLLVQCPCRLDAQVEVVAAGGDGGDYPAVDQHVGTGDERAVTRHQEGS